MEALSGNCLTTEEQFGDRDNGQNRRILDVDNNIYSGNKIFSNVTSFEFVDEDIINLHLKMWEIMKETDLKNMIRAKNSKSL